MGLSGFGSKVVDGNACVAPPDVNPMRTCSVLALLYGEGACLVTGYSAPVGSHARGIQPVVVQPSGKYSLFLKGVRCSQFGPVSQRSRATIPLPSRAFIPSSSPCDRHAWVGTPSPSFPIYILPLFITITTARHPPLHHLRAPIPDLTRLEQAT